LRELDYLLPQENILDTACEFFSYYVKFMSLSV
jgi:hypothetical protein